MINEHYDYADGVSKYCVILGDVSSTAERAEFQHAKIKLDSLDCPWVPIIGNHDTWPRASASSKKDDDRYLEQIFKSQFGIDYDSHAKKAFPVWVRAQFPSTVHEEPHWYNWCFRWGANHHQGLDWVKRSYGGSAWSAKDYHESKWAPHGTYHWFSANTDYHSNYTKNLMIYAHNPLSSSVSWPWPQFSTSERTRITEVVDDNYEWAMTHWFCGHAHDGTKPSKHWSVGLDGSGSDTVIKVHFFPGVYGKESVGDGIWGNHRHFVGYVKVHDDYKCNFSWTHPSSHPDFVNVGDVVTYIEDCDCYYSWSVASYLWEFGDGSLSYSSAPTHTFNYVNKFYTKLTAPFTSGQYTYCSKPILVGFQYPQISRVRFFQRTTSSGMNASLAWGTTWKANISWWDKYYTGWYFDSDEGCKYELWRKIQYYPDYTFIGEKTTRSTKLSNSLWDDGPFQSNHWVYFKVLGKVKKVHHTELGESSFPPEDFWSRDTFVQVPPDPDPPPSCPEVYSLIGYDPGTGEFEFAPNNTVLAHSPTNPIAATDMLVLDHPLYEHEGFTAVTIIERNTETSAWVQQ